MQFRPSIRFARWMQHQLAWPRTLAAFSAKLQCRQCRFRLMHIPSLFFRVEDTSTTNQNFLFIFSMQQHHHNDGHSQGTNPGSPLMPVFGKFRQVRLCGRAHPVSSEGNFLMKRFQKVSQRFCHPLIFASPSPGDPGQKAGLPGLPSSRLLDGSICSIVI